MHLNHLEDPCSGEVTGKTEGMYLLLGVPGLILIILFLVGVGH
jgi:hypothetical protein